MKLSEIIKFINATLFPIIALGLMFLFACDFLHALYTTGKPSDKLEEEVIGLIGYAMGKLEKLDAAAIMRSRKHKEKAKKN